MKLYLIFIFLLPFSANAQVRTYLIQGKLKQPINGRVYLFSDIIKKKYYGRNPVLDSAKLIEGKFWFKRIMYQDAWPIPYRLSIQSDSFQGTTGMILIEQKNQTIVIDSLSDYIAPVIIKSSFQDELKNEYEVFFKPFVLRANILENHADSLYSNQESLPTEALQELVQMQNHQSIEGDSLFYSYAKMHPNSRVTLWKLIERFSNLGYKNIYSDIFKLLKDSLKRSEPGQLLMHDLNIAKLLAIGNIFPILKLKDTSRKTIFLDTRNSPSKYILIDFWFCSCAPCLREFPSYKKLYYQYHNVGFEIIGISIDNKKDILKWKEVIKKQNLSWNQYLDEDSKLSKKLSINTFPTNFLIDKNGRIIKKNITKKELEEYLLKL